MVKKKLLKKVYLMLVMVNLPQQNMLKVNLMEALSTKLYQLSYMARYVIIAKPLKRRGTLLVV